MPAVARISITPLKSTALQHPERVVLGPHGVAENRRFFLVDEAGRLLRASKHPALFSISATYDASRDRLAVRLPDGIVVAGDAGADGERVVVDFWGRATPGRIVAGPYAELLAALLGLRVRLVRAEEDGGGSDDAPVTLVSSASVHELARHAGRAAVDARRFRALFELDGLAPHEEDGWQGRRVRLGAAVVRVGGPVPRCDVTQRDPESGARDLETLRAIKSYRGRGAAGQLDFGVYAEVVEPGPVAVGDEVVPEG